ncbi:LysR substrate-binding domain-containing protein [Aliikangiella sp. G2MR2-5]|uniref:LysR substrate-binding domain-containing protein n=1 Tax=Aliikangiella sp. G2MR2-5 TaxID=2788943 RepID=UPI0018AC74C0|nr:LysR substrate-binding domain-containing protein [Aliikangiella sp. G2MR2-5]
MAKALRFELIDLRLFVLVVQTGSISKAAEAMPIALSAASTRIKGLEERLQTRLFKRMPRGVELTHSGKVFLDYANRLLTTAKEAQQDMDALGGRGRERLRVLSNTTGLSTNLTRALGRYLANNPQIDLAVERFSSKKIISAVSAGQADIGIVDGDYQHHDLITLVYQRNQLVVLTNGESEIAPLESCRFVDYLKHPMIGYEEESSLQQFIQRMSLLSHRTASFRATAPDFESVASLVSAKVGNAIMPKPVAENYSNALGLKIIRLDESWANRELKICINSRLDSNVQAQRLAKYLAGWDSEQQL